MKKTIEPSAPTRVRVSFEMEIPAGVLVDHVRAVYRGLKRWVPWKVTSWRWDFV